MKKFIMSCPMQPEGKLNKVIYKTVENKKLVYGETRFPIIPVINAYSDDGECVEVILIETDHQNTELNKGYLIEELNELKTSRKIEYELKEVMTPYDENINTQISLFTNTIELLDNTDELFACITYGAKPTPIIEMMLLNYAYRALEGVNVKCIVYGKFNHSTKESEIYDVTSLLYLDEVVNNVASMNLKNPAQIIKQLMDD